MATCGIVFFSIGLCFVVVAAAAAPPSFPLSHTHYLHAVYILHTQNIHKTPTAIAFTHRWATFWACCLFLSLSTNSSQSHGPYILCTAGIVINSVQLNCLGTFHNTLAAESVSREGSSKLPESRIVPAIHKKELLVTVFFCSLIHLYSIIEDALKFIQLFSSPAYPSAQIGAHFLMMPHIFLLKRRGWVSGFHPSLRNQSWNTTLHFCQIYCEVFSLYNNLRLKGSTPWKSFSPQEILLKDKCVRLNEPAG